MRRNSGQRLALGLLSHGLHKHLEVVALHLLLWNLFCVLASGEDLSLPKSIEDNCQLTRGDWCKQYFTQEPLPSVAPPRGDKDCPNACSGVGVCHHDTGLCYCPAGHGGPDCSQPRKRPCWRSNPDTRRDWGWLNATDWGHSRCAGICDDAIAFCYCPPETRYGRQDPPTGSPLGTPPLRPGRPLYMCHPNTDEEGQHIRWGKVPYQDLFGPHGWCNADVPKYTCPCRIDGVVGSLCNIRVEHYCPNQCSGHGECNLGFCKCHAGWYGHDCSRKRAGLEMEEGDEVALKPWLRPVLNPVPAAADPPAAGATRLRPLIYVYDVPPEFTTDILQYRIERSHCTYRFFEHKNVSRNVGYYAYAVEGVMHELFLSSPHRTFDPEEADFFYVPLQFACLFDVYGWNPIPRWPAGVHGTRTFGAANMQRAAAAWLNATLPWFKRRGGRDHIWLTAHDEGACYVWKDIWPGIMLTHWGRMDFPHASGTSYGADNYSSPMHHASFEGDWRDHTSLAHPCYDPVKDLVVPTFKYPASLKDSPYMGARAHANRTMRVFFRGDTGLARSDPKGLCRYSRCIRQRLLNMSRDHGWREKHGIFIGTRTEIKGDFTSLLMDSTFCLVMPGEGWGHPEDAIVHGCIPIIIMDDVHQPFESILQYDTFALRLREADLERLPAIVEAVSPQQVAQLRANLHRVWHRFRYNGLALHRAESRKILDLHRSQNGGLVRQHEGVQYADSDVNDAFQTILQWLHSRIADTR